MTQLDDAWKELIATALRRNVVVAVGEHRAAIEAETRAKAVDVLDRIGFAYHATHSPDTSWMLCEEAFCRLARAVLAERHP